MGQSLGWCNRRFFSGAFTVVSAASATESLGILIPAGQITSLEGEILADDSKYLKFSLPVTPTTGVNSANLDTLGV